VNFFKKEKKERNPISLILYVLIYLFLIRELISLKILSTIHFLAFSLHENFLGVLLKQLIKMSPRDLFLILSRRRLIRNKKISPLFHTLLSLFSRTQNFVSRTSPSRQQALVLISSSIARRALIATPWSPSSLAPKPWLSGAQSLSCLRRRSQPLAGFPAHPISPWNQATRCAQPSRSISLASSSPVRECAPSIPVPKLVYNLPACSWWELAAVPLSSRPWWSPIVAPSAPSRCARRGSCPAAEQSAPWSSPAPYLAFLWSAFLSLNYGCVVSMPGLVELRPGSLSFSSRPAQLDSRSSSPFPLPYRGSCTSRKELIACGIYKLSLAVSVIARQ
jgi:hypothetical protein